MWKKNSLTSEPCVQCHRASLMEEGSLLSDLQNENNILREELSKMCNRISNSSLTAAQYHQVTLTRDVGTGTEWTGESSLSEIRLHEEKMLNSELDKQIIYLDAKIISLEDLISEMETWKLEVTRLNERISELKEKCCTKQRVVLAMNAENFKIKFENGQLREVLIQEQSKLKTHLETVKNYETERKGKLHFVFLYHI
jgi:regulator of replication initiation timing